MRYAEGDPDGPRMASDEPPKGFPTPSNFELREHRASRHWRKGWCASSNRWLSVDPYMRGRMNDVKSYVAPFQLGEPMDGGAIGEVVESAPRASRRAIWSSTWPGGATRRWLARALNKLPDLGVEPQRFLGAPRRSRATAWFGLLDVAAGQGRRDRFRVRRRRRSGSAVAIQIAKTKGMTVIGSAGAGEVRLRAIARRRPGRRLQGGPGPQVAGPSRTDGIDVYFDNVGGGHLDAALAIARRPRPLRGLRDDRATTTHRPELPIHHSASSLRAFA